MYINKLDIEITKREILFSIIIVLLMLISGLGIHSKIKQNSLDNNEVYNKSLKITSPTEFVYGMQTNIGNAFVQGDLITIDPVSYPDVKGEYMYISKETQRYTMHTRIISYTDSDGKSQTRTEIYWTWDKIDFESKQCKEVNFNTVVFDSSKFNLPAPTYITTNTYNDIRYIYYGLKAQYNGTILASLKNNTIYNIQNENSPIPFYNNSLQETYNLYINKGTLWLVLFWIGWVLLTAALIFVFCYFENTWLN